MLNKVVINVEHVSKVYKLFNKPMDRLKESLNPFRKIYHKDYFALEDITFSINQGETVGIIGANGAGKSTILKILTGISVPTSGSMQIEGKVSALLELGAGFNPDYSGLQNIYLNGTTMGYSKSEMDKRLEDILQFADIGEFIYQPVKNYSSGMFVRLAFAVAVNVDPDVLIIDEALSVGDVFFQLKCYKKIQDFKDKGKTILLVTHDINNVIQYCDRAIFLERGKKVAEGSSKEIVDLYKKSLAGFLESLPPKNTQEFFVYETSKLLKDKIEINPQFIEYGTREAEIEDYAILNEAGHITSQLTKDELCTFVMRVSCHSVLDEPIFAYAIKDVHGTEITGSNTMLEKISVGTIKAGDVFEVSFTQRLTLQGGPYYLSFGCTSLDCQGDIRVFHRLYDVICITIGAKKVSVGYFDMNSKVSIKKVEKMVI